MTPSPISGLWRATQAEVAEVSALYGPLVTHVPDEIDAGRLMMAFALTESIVGQHDQTLFFPPRFEPAYAFGGHYCVGEVADLWVKYGRPAACSYGPWQTMFFAAKGYTPAEMHDIEKCAQVFVAYMNRELLTQPPNTPDPQAAIARIGKAYNHGNWRDNFDDSAYQTRLLNHYNSLGGKAK